MKQAAKKKSLGCVLLLAICTGCIPLLELLDMKMKYGNDPFFDLSSTEQSEFLANEDIETKFHYHVAVIEYIRPNFIYDFSVELAAEENYIPFAIEKLKTHPRELEIYALFIPLKELDVKRKKALNHDDEAMKILYNSMEGLRDSLSKEICERIYREILAVE